MPVWKIQDLRVHFYYEIGSQVQQELPNHQCLKYIERHCPKRASSRNAIWQNCIRQESLYDCPSKSLQLLDRKLIYKYDFQNLVIMLLINMKEIFLANNLIMNTHQVKLKHIWIADIEFIVLNHSIKKIFDEDIKSFSY